MNLPTRRSSTGCLFAACLCSPASSAFAQGAADAYDGRFRDTAVTYADTMIQVGRDTYGTGTMASGDSKTSGLFLSALDRKATGGPAPLTDIPYFDSSRDRYGIRVQDRVHDRRHAPGEQRLVGANPAHDQELYKLLYRLDGEVAPAGPEGYKQVADAALGWFFRNSRSGVNGDVTQGTDLVAWGEHASWDPYNDKAIGAANDYVKHEFYTNWDLWKEVQDVAPAAIDAYAVGLYRQQIRDKTTGEFNRDAPFDGAIVDNDGALDFPRHAGYHVRTWAEALADGGVTSSDAELVEAIDVVLGRYEGKRAASAQESGMEPGLVPFTIDTRLREGVPENKFAQLMSNMELSVQAAASAELLRGSQPGLADRLETYAAAGDEAYLLFDHGPTGDGLVNGVDVRNRELRSRQTQLWGKAYGGSPMSGDAAILISRYEQLAAGGSVTADTAGAFRDIILGIADAYVGSDPDGTNGEAPDGDYYDEPIWGEELASVILLELFAFEQTGEQQYLDQAIEIGDLGRDIFFGPFALPRAAGNAGHYEAITGGDDLALALYELDRVLVDVPEPAVASMLLGGTVLLGGRCRR